MSIVEETRIALLDLFPEQAAADAIAREEAAVEAKAKAEAEAEAQALAEAAGSEAEETEPKAEEEAAEPEAKAKPKAKGKAAKAEPEPPRENGVLQTDHAARGTHIDVLCAPDQVVEAAKIMDEAGFFLESISGVDWNKDEKIEVIYDYSQFGLEACRVVVRAFIDRTDPEIASITDVHPSAEWHERETFDFFGINFIGHPYLVRILLPEDADFHPLLKDFVNS